MRTQTKSNGEQSDRKEMLLEIGTEGGSLSIVRFRAPDGVWKFAFTMNEAAMADFLDKEDQMDLVKQYPPVETFEEALQLMNKYPWQYMHVISVHSEFADTVQQERERRLQQSRS